MFCWVHLLAATVGAPCRLYSASRPPLRSGWPPRWLPSYASCCLHCVLLSEGSRGRFRASIGHNMFRSLASLDLEAAGCFILIVGFVCLQCCPNQSPIYHDTIFRIGLCDHHLAPHLQSGVQWFWSKPNFAACGGCVGLRRGHWPRRHQPCPAMGCPCLMMAKSRRAWTWMSKLNPFRTSARLSSYARLMCALPLSISLCLCICRCLCLCPCVSVSASVSVSLSLSFSFFSISLGLPPRQTETETEMDGDSKSRQAEMDGNRTHPVTNANRRWPMCCDASATHHPRATTLLPAASHTSCSVCARREC